MVILVSSKQRADCRLQIADLKKEKTEDGGRRMESRGMEVVEKN